VTVRRCSEISLDAHESLVATATTAEHWLLVEVPGSWPRDVSDGGALPESAHGTAIAWIGRTQGSRLLYIRRPGRSAAAPTLVFVVHAAESTTDVRRIELEQPDELAAVDFDQDGDRIDQQLVLVCGHGTRDACCALYGSAVFGALRGRLAEEELWISSHQGGHRFAANALVFPAGLQFGRLGLDDAPLVIARALAGRIELDRYRGRTCYSPTAQAAEHAVRRERALEGVSDLQLFETAGGIVRFRSPNGAEYAASVEEIVGPSVAASCGADLEPQKVFRATLV
jgi:hypothetical protein